MKKNLIILLLAVLGMTQLSAQESDYTPFVREGVKWVYFYDNVGILRQYDRFFPEGRSYFSLEIKGDTMIDTKEYKSLHKYDYSVNENNDAMVIGDTVVLFLREDNKVVYGIASDDLNMRRCLVGYGPELGAVPSIYHQVLQGQEFVLYNFKDTKNYYDSICWRYGEDDPYNPHVVYYYLYCDTIRLANWSAKRHNFHFIDDFYIIEGIGYDGYRAGYTLAYLFTEYYPGPQYWLSHVIENGEIIYRGVKFDPQVRVGLDEAIADPTARPTDPHFYDLMGRDLGTDVPSSPGIYIHQGKKICVSRMP